MIQRVLFRTLLAAVFAVTTAFPAFAQGGASSTISGTVTDSSGGVIPGATVVLTSESGTTQQTISNNEGVFSVPALAAGPYKVAVSLQGFKTWTTDVRLQPNQPIALKAVLEVGQLTDVITVTTSSELINTQTPTVSSTLNADQLNRMPTPTRNALNAVTFLPGVNSTGINRNSTVNGLPDSMINITLDGVSNNDNFLRSSDPFFASVTPRQDAVEAVTVTTAAAGANQGGSGAVTINFATRSGTNRFSGSTYEYFRDPVLNSNYWFNERVGDPKNDVRLNQFGGRAGGPLVLPGLYDGRGKAFYFFHYEQLRFPNSFTRTRTVHKEAILDGIYDYNVNGVNKQVNVLAVAAKYGQISAVDPTVRMVLNNIFASTRVSGTRVATSDPLIDNFQWQSENRLFEHQPTIKLDYNFNQNHRLSGSYQIISTQRDGDYLNNADRNFPGAPNYRLYNSVRPLLSMTLRSTLGPNMVNELRGGGTAVSGSSQFGNDKSNGVASFADIGGNAIVLPLVTDWWRERAPSWRAAPTYTIDESLSWQKGRHSLNFGGQFLRATAWENAQQIVPQYTLGFNTTSDPAASIFSNTTPEFADIPSLANLRAVYAMLTGRVSSIAGQAVLDPADNRYKPFIPRRREGSLNSYSLFAQDAWRVKPSLTINAGLRWDLQRPFVSANDTMSAVSLQSACGISGLGDGSAYNKCAFYTRNNTGFVPSYDQLTSGTKGYNVDWNNVAPSVGFAWQPNVESGFLRTILGDPTQATVRAGYSVAYERQGMGIFTGLYGGNPGSTIALTRNATTGLVPAGESWPVLLSQTDRLYQASFPDTPTYPFALRANRQDNLNLFAPDIQIASARTWTVGLQRSLSKDMAMEVRYVGTKGVDQWSSLNYNTRDLINNGFLDEFKLAVNNLRANNQAGGTRAGSFAYFGPGTGTAPLPTYLAYINASTNATSAAAYSGTTWTNTGLTQDLVFQNPSPGNSAADLDGDATRRANALAAGLPANLFVVNPAANQVNVTDSGAFSDFHALQVELRRRLSRGLQANVNYQYALERTSAFVDFTVGRTQDITPSVRHAIKTQWDWELPFGRGHRYGANWGGIMDGLLGGWSFNGVGRIQSRMVSFGNVRLVGMSQDELQSMYAHAIRVNPANGLNSVYMMPDDVILNTRRAFSTSPSSIDGWSALGAPEGRYIAPANSADCIQARAGDCAPRQLLVRAPWFTRFDVGVGKKFALKGSSNVEFRLDILNVLDNVNFDIYDPSANLPLTSANIFSVTTAYQDTSNTFDPGGRLGQIMVRFNW